MIFPKLCHLGVAVQNIDKALSVYKALFGYRVLYGPVYDELQHVTVCFVGTGEPSEFSMELIEPGGEESPINKILAKGGGAYHACYEVDNIDEFLLTARSQNCVILGRPVPAVAFQGRRIAWLYLSSGQLMEILER